MSSKDKPVQMDDAASIKRRRAYLLSIGLGLLTLYAVLIHGGLVQGTAAYWVTDVSWTVFSGAAAWRSFVTARHQTIRHYALAWYWFAGANFTFFAGQLIWDYNELVLGKYVPFPAVSDFFYVFWPLLFVVSVFYYRAQRPTANFTLFQLGNLGILLSCLTLVFFTILYAPIQQSDKPLIWVITGLSYPITFTLAFFFALFCYWFYIWRGHRHIFILMLLAAAVHNVADALYVLELLGNRFGPTNYLNMGWLIPFFLAYWAAFEQDALTKRPSTSEQEVYEVRGRDGLDAVIPALALLVTVGVLFLYRGQFSQATLRMMMVTGILFALFLFMREWWTSKIQADLVESIRAARDDLDAKVKQRTAELEAANKELESFSYSVSHDLRTPLRGIDGFSRALLETYPDRLDERGKHYLDRVRAGAQRMGRLIDDLLNLSRVTRHTMRSETVVDLSALARDIAEDLRQTQTQRQVEFRIQGGLQAQGDAHLLHIALQNLLANAWKFTSRHAHAVIEFGLVEHQEGDVYFVRDDGAGFDMAYAGKLFGAFQRLHDETEFEGSGIGLATVQRIIHRHGGRIWAQGAPEQGATFYFTLPAHPVLRA